MDKHFDSTQDWIKEFAIRLKVDLDLMLFYSQKNINEVIDECAAEVIRDIERYK